jgi:hypothetical protein
MSATEILTEDEDGDINVIHAWQKCHCLLFQLCHVLGVMLAIGAVFVHDIQVVFSSVAFPHSITAIQLLRRLLPEEHKWHGCCCNKKYKIYNVVLNGVTKALDA